jgi:hypothetical protein
MEIIRHENEIQKKRVRVQLISRQQKIIFDIRERERERERGLKGSREREI